MNVLNEWKFTYSLKTCFFVQFFLYYTRMSLYPTRWRVHNNKYHNNRMMLLWEKVYWCLFFYCFRYAVHLNKREKNVKDKCMPQQENKSLTSKLHKLKFPYLWEFSFSRYQGQFSRHQKYQKAKVALGTRLSRFC